MTVRIRNIDLNLLKVFDAIMREQSIKRAATRLCVSQPAISNSLRRLRMLYNDELFIRNAKDVIPTPKAQEIAVSVHEALRNIEDTLDIDGQFRPEVSHRKFTVSLTDYAEHCFLPLIMQRVSSVAPGVEVVCLPAMGATLMSEMRFGAVDLVWDWLAIDDQDYSKEVVFEDKSCLVGRKGHPQIGGPVTLEQFLCLEHVVLRPTRTHIPVIERELEKLGHERKVVAEVSHVSAIPGIIAKTDLVACLPERLARFYASQLPLELYPNPVFQGVVPAYQMWHNHFDDDAGHRWFRTLLLDVARQA